jgi:hypothetical protein
MGGWIDASVDASAEARGDTSVDARGDVTWLEPIRKANGGVRLIAHLSSSDVRAYHASVAPLVSRIERALGARSIANRTRGRSSDRPIVALEPWRIPRRRFHRVAASLAAHSAAAAIADVHECYGSIRDDVLERRLRGLGASPREIRPLRRVLDRLHEQGIRGLPIGPEPSAALANAVLGRIDRALEEARVRHVRWVDDVWMFARDERSAASAMRVLEDSLSAIALSPAPEKTRLIGPEAIAECVRGERLSPAGARL